MNVNDQIHKYKVIARWAGCIRKLTDKKCRNYSVHHYTLREMFREIKIFYSNQILIRTIILNKICVIHYQIINLHINKFIIVVIYIKHVCQYICILISSSTKIRFYGPKIEFFLH